MMRKIFVSSTVLFWLSVGAIWAVHLWLPTPVGNDDAVAAETRYTLSDVALHSKKDDCWMAIRD